ncbi:MAG: helicase-related protein [Christensenellales bacterium]
MITPYPAQELKIKRILETIQPNHPVIDTSKTGTGKTFTALWTAQRMGVKPFVVCPKSAKPIWEQASADLGIELDDLVNYELLRRGSHERLWTKIEERHWRKADGNSKIYKNFFCNWSEPKPKLIIFDEAHACAGMHSQTSNILIQAYKQWIPTLCLTATLADSPLKFKAFGYITGLHSLSNYTNWLESMSCRKVERRGWQFAGGNRGLKLMKWLHDTLKERGHLVQITLDDLPASMNEGIIIPELREIEHARKVGNMYNIAASKAQFMEACVASEKAKADIFIEDGRALLEEGNSVIFFVNFHETVDILRKAFPDAGAVTGNDKDRERVVNDFQANRTRVLICTTGAGGQSINLHDVHGGHPRVSLISPSFNATQFVQVLGRTVRAGGKSGAIRKIIFAAGTVEELAYSSVRSKINRIDTLTDGDLTTFQG